MACINNRFSDCFCWQLICICSKRKLIAKEEQLNLVAEADVKEILQKDYDKPTFRMTQQSKDYNDFCKAYDLQPQYDRIKAADFGRKQTKQANQGARRYKNIVNSVDSGTIKTGAKNGALTSKNDPDFKKRYAFA